jgi:hypothetical protein
LLAPKSNGDGKPLNPTPQYEEDPVAKLGVITDGISRDFEHALKVMAQAGLDYAELQYL